MKEVATSISEDTLNTQYGRYLAFYLDQEVFGIEIRYVTEIIGMQKISSLPECPDYIKGMINLRGNVIPVIDMRLRMKKKSASYTDRTCTVVIDLAGTPVGLIVDRVDEVLFIDDQNILPPPDFKTGYHSRYLKGFGKTGENILLLLDCERLFRTEELEEFSKIAE